MRLLAVVRCELNLIFVHADEPAQPIKPKWRHHGIATIAANTYATAYTGLMRYIIG